MLLMAWALMLAARRPSVRELVTRSESLPLSELLRLSVPGTATLQASASVLAALLSSVRESAKALVQLQQQLRLSGSVLESVPPSVPALAMQTALA